MHSKRNQLNNDSVQKRSQESVELGPARIRKLELPKIGQISNLSKFREQMKSFATLTFAGSDLSDVFEYNRAPIIPHIIVDQVAYAEASKDELTKMLFETDIRTRFTERTKKELRVENDLKILYVILWDQLDLETQNTVMRQDSYAQYELKRDVVWLWNVVLKLHRTGSESEAAANTANAVISFATVKQRKFESIHAFYKRFKEEYEAYSAAGGPEMTELVRVQLFNKALNEYYEAYTKKIKNDEIFNVASPQTLEANYIAASKYVAPEIGARRESTSAVFYTGDQRQLADSKKPIKLKHDKSQKDTTKRFDQKSQRNGNRRSDEWVKTAVCHGCHKVGHLVRNCPELRDHGESNGLNGAVVRCVGNVSATPAEYLIGLDSGAHTTILRNTKLLSNIVRDDCQPLLDWHGNSIKNQIHGEFHPFGYAEYNPAAPLNLLSEYEAKSRYNFVEVPMESVTFFTPYADVMFTMDHDRKMFVCDWRKYSGVFKCSPIQQQVSVVINSVRQNEAMYSKREVELAREARIKIANSGYMSKEDIIRLASSSGNIVNLNLNKSDILRAIDIYGQQNVLMGRSRLIRPDTRVARAEPQPKVVQTLHTDMFYVAGVSFLVCCAKPLGVMFVVHMDRHTESDYGIAFENFISILRGYGYAASVIYSDADAAVIANVNQHGKVRVECSGPGDHENDAEVRIRTIKERFRSVKSGVLFPLTKSLTIELVFYIVSRINLSISQYSTDGLCPRVRLTGELVDAEKELCVGFGAYVIARNKNVRSNDALELRGEACIALRPIGNRQGSWRLLKLINGRIVSRSQFKEQPMTDAAVARLEELALLESKGELPITDDEVEYEEPIGDVIDDRVLEKSMPVSVVSVKYEPGYVVKATSSEDTEHGTTNSVEYGDREDSVAETAIADDPDVAKYEIKPEPLMVSVAEDSTPIRPSSRFNERTRVHWNKKTHAASNAFAGTGVYHISPKVGYQKYGKAAIQSQYKEMKSLLENGTFEGVLTETLSGQQKNKIIRSFMFLKEKFSADGKFEKLKSRLVANGAEMDRTEFTDLSSPTPALTSIFVGSSIAAKEGREIAVMDVCSAFLKASMKSEKEVLVVLDRLSTALLVQLDPTYEKFINGNEEIIVRLNKALYGCLQAAKLWFKLLIAELMKLGYKQNEHDVCVLNKNVGDDQSTLMIHVDDIKILSKIPGEIDLVYNALVKAFGNVTIHKGPVVNYLGMTFDYTVAGQVRVTMLGYELDLTKEWCEATKDFKIAASSAVSPATNAIFEKGDGEMLSTAKRKLYHSFVMKVAYLAKRTRPEISVCTSYLSTQVTCPNENDFLKLDRLVRYVKGSTGSGIVLKVDGDKEITITGHIDASFGCHVDGKSHSGVVITLGKGPVFVRSAKQRIVTKSSTEAELVALSDEAVTVLNIFDFVRAQGYNAKFVIGQDNMSTIQLITNRDNVSMRTKHINVRYFWLREKYLANEFVITHVPTGLMLADVLTKPMQGSMLRRFVKLLCNDIDK